MDYQITCVCGHSFLVPEQQLRGSTKRAVTCPKCGQQLNPVIEPRRANALPPPQPPTVVQPDVSNTPDDPNAPIETTVATAIAEETKRCPFCGEVILAIARKCKHCGEFLDRSPPPDSAASGAAALQSAAVPSSPVPPPDVPPVYSLAVSQWDNFWKFLILLVLAAAIIAGMIFFKAPKDTTVMASMGTLVIAGFIGWFFYLNTKHTRVYIRPNRIDTEQGILSKELNSLELFRISDLELKQGILERILGIGTIKIMTAESGGGAATDGHGEPELVLYQIPKAREVYKYIQNQIPIAAKQRGAIYMEK